MTEYKNPKCIWLQPWCAECDAADQNFDTGRLWSEDDPWGKCQDCGRKAVKYVLPKGHVDG